ncbi:MAG TPA: CapA family protein [Anaerolineales bacterium]|nr:CapA family protein [Anaerolineales bacterium]
MRTRILLVNSLLAVAWLAACAQAPLPTLIVMPTITPSLPQPTPTDPPLILSETPSPVPDTATPTETPTLAPSATPTLTETSSPSRVVNLDAVGDIMLGRTIADQVLANGPQVVFAGVQSVLDQADLRVGNLECSISSHGSPVHKSYTIQAPPITAKALALGKFDLVTLANNHSMDYGIQGLADTQNNLSLYGIESVGAGTNFSRAHMPVILEKNGLRLAFLGYVDVPVENTGFDAHTWIATQTQPGIAWADPNQIKIDVAAAKTQADLVIVMLHSGYENVSSVMANQSREAHAAIDAGASLVIGAHPHILQGIERYHGGLIAYSLGNFVFDDYQGISNATIILHVVLTPQGVQSYDYVPVVIENGLPAVTAIENAMGIQTLVAPLNP